MVDFLSICVICFRPFDESCSAERKKKKDYSDPNIWVCDNGLSNKGLL